MNDSTARATLFRFLPIGVFVCLGLVLTIFLSQGAPAWANDVDAAGTLPIIKGTVNLQGRPAKPDPSWSVPLVVTLHNPGASAPAFTYNVSTDQYGRFSITHPVSGTYLCDIRVKNRHTLRNVKVGVTLLPDDNNIHFGTLLEGDANNNNVVEIADFSILATHYDTYNDPRADFNENKWIEIADFSLLATNFDRRGDVGVTLAAGEPEAVAAADPVPMDLKLTPSYWIAPVGGTFTVDVRLDPKGQPFQGLAAYLQFNPAQLQVVDVNGDPAGEIDSSGQLPTLIRNEVDNDAGQISFSAGVALGGVSPTDEFTVATIRFKVLAVDLVGSDVNFIVQQFPPRTGVTYQGYYQPLNVAGLRVRTGFSRVICGPILNNYTGDYPSD